MRAVIAWAQTKAISCWLVCSTLGPVPEYKSSPSATSADWTLQSHFPTSARSEAVWPCPHEDMGCTVSHPNPIHCRDHILLTIIKGKENILSAIWRSNRNARFIYIPYCVDPLPLSLVRAVKEWSWTLHRVGAQTDAEVPRICCFWQRAMDIREIFCVGQYKGLAGWSKLGAMCFIFHGRESTATHFRCVCVCVCCPYLCCHRGSAQAGFRLILMSMSMFLSLSLWFSLLSRIKCYYFL